MLTIVSLVLFFHSSVARMALACSGSFMSHSFESCLSLVIAVLIVLCAFPFFWSWNPYSSIVPSCGRFNVCEVGSPEPAAAEAHRSDIPRLPRS